MKAMMNHFESQTRDQRSRLSFLFPDLRNVISDLRHLRKATAVGRLCAGRDGGASDMGTRMQRLHTNLLNSMREKVLCTFTTLGLLACHLSQFDPLFEIMTIFTSRCRTLL